MVVGFPTRFPDITQTADFPQIEQRQPLVYAIAIKLKLKVHPTTLPANSIGKPAS